MLAGMADEVLIYIFSWLDKNTLMQLALVSKQMQRLAEEEQLWMNESVTRELIERTGLSAKCLYQLQPLFQGNYLSKLGGDAFSRLKEKLNHTDAQPGRQINIFVNYSIKEATSELIKAAIENEVFCERTTNNRFLNAMLSMCKYSLHKRITAYKWDEVGVKYANHLYTPVIPLIHCTMIFTDNQQKLENTCHFIKKFYDDNQTVSPFIFVVTLPHCELNLNAIDLPIESILYLPNHKNEELSDNPKQTFLDDFLAQIDAILKMKPVTPTISDSFSQPIVDLVKKNCMVM